MNKTELEKYVKSRELCDVPSIGYTYTIHAVPQDVTRCSWSVFDTHDINAIRKAWQLSCNGPAANPPTIFDVTPDDPVRTAHVSPEARTFCTILGQGYDRKSIFVNGKPEGSTLSIGFRYGRNDTRNKRTFYDNDASALLLRPECDQVMYYTNEYNLSLSAHAMSLAAAAAIVRYKPTASIMTHKLIDGTTYTGLYSELTSKQLKEARHKMFDAEWKTMFSLISVDVLTTLRAPYLQGLIKRVATEQSIKKLKHLGEYGMREFAEVIAESDFFKSKDKHTHETISNADLSKLSNKLARVLRKYGCS